MTTLPFGQIAPVSRRAVAYLIDALIAAGLSIVLGGGLMIVATLSGSLEAMLTTILVGGPVVSLLLLGWFVVYTIMQAGKGSIGMRAQGLRLVREADGSSLGFGRTLLRNIIFGLTVSIVVGYFTPLFDGSGRFQGWHDKVAKSLMLDARAAGATPAASAPTQAAPVPTQALPVPPVPGLPTPVGFPPPVGLPAAPGLLTPSVPDVQLRPAPPLPPAPQPSFPQTPSAPAAQPAQHPAAPAGPSGTDDPLIAFVPGITQDAPPARNTPSTTDREPSGVPEETQLRGQPPAPEVFQPAVAPAVAPVADAAQDEFDIEETRISIPGHRLVFTWDDGTRVSVSRRTVFGRNPSPEEGAVSVPVRDETLSLSKTHFEAAAEAVGGWVIDRHSTNGTTIVRDGQRIPCPPGEQVRIRLGDAIAIGDRIVTVGGYA